MNLFEVLFVTALSAAQKPIETCTKETLKCPITKEQWDKRYREFPCFEEGTNYTCLQAVGGILVEACSYPDIIEGSMGKCPVFYACDGTIPVLGLDANFNDCADDVKGCPGKNHPKYTLNEMYKYPACITNSWTELSTSTELTVKPEMENESYDEYTTIYIVLPIAICVVIILTILGAVFWFVRKRKTRNRARLGNDTEESQPLRILPADEMSKNTIEESPQPLTLHKEGEVSENTIEESSQPLTLHKEEIESLDEKMPKGTARGGNYMRSQDDPGASILYYRSAPELPIPTIGVLTHREETEASLRDALLERYNDEINRVRASPLQTTSNIPIHELYSPVSIREDLEYKYRGRKMGRGDDPGKNTKAVEGPDDIFKIDGKKAKNVFMIGDAGYGKSVFCLRLIHFWLGLVGEKNIEPNDKEWIKYLQTFDFIFLVRLRLLLDMSQTSLASMICHDLFKNDRKFHNLIHDVLENDNRHCLVLIDGLDEAKLETGVLPTTEGLNNCTLFWTSRPWKLDEVSHVILGRDRVVEIHGLSDKGVNTFTENILVNQLLVKKGSDEYKGVEEKIKQEKMTSILRNPLMAMACIELWHENKNVGNSFTRIHMALLDLLIKRALKDRRITKEIKEYFANLPENQSASFVLRQYDIDKAFICVLVNFGKVAYDDLSSGNPSLVFRKSTLEKILGEKDLFFGLQTGLLSMCEAPGCGNIENVSVNFFHKSMQEFLAAIFIEVNKSVKDAFFSKVLSSIEKILEFENILIFLSGLNHHNLGRISSHTVCIANDDSDISSYREYRDLFHRYKRVELLYRLQSRCLCENKNEFFEEHGNPKFHVADINIHFENGKELIDNTKDILKHHYDDVKSLWIEWVPTDSNNGISDDTVAEFLDQAKSLKSLCINGSKDKNIRTLRNVTEVFSSLTALVLLRVIVTPDGLDALLNKMQSNTVLRTFGFTTRNMEPIGQRTQPSISRLIDILPSFKSLSTLYIRIENPDDKPSLINALSQMKNLHTIYYYGIDPADDPFNQTVAEKICQMKSLHTLGLCILTFRKDDARVSLSPDMTQLEQVMIYETKMTDLCWENFLRSLHEIRCNREIHVFVETNNEYGNGLKIIRSCKDFKIVDDQTHLKDEYGHYNITFKKPATS